MEASTEEKILQAAKEVFIRQGFAGARMQEIADKAGINKGLLHYYFRSKEKLFRGVFFEAFRQVAPKLDEILALDRPVLEKIEIFIHQYIDILKERPYLPLFVIHELERNPQDFVREISQRTELPNPGPFFLQLQAEIDAGKIRPIEPLQLVLNIVSMCVFPFVARPILHGVLQLPEDAFEDLMEQRKKVVVEFVQHALRT